MPYVKTRLLRFLTYGKCLKVARKLLVHHSEGQLVIVRAVLRSIPDIALTSVSGAGAL